MPTVKNKQTGVEYNLPLHEYNKLKANLGLSRGFEFYPIPVMPEEVKALLKKAPKQKKEKPAVEEQPTAENSDVEQSGSSLDS